MTHFVVMKLKRFMFSSPSVPGKNQGLHVALTGCAEAVRDGSDLLSICRADFDIQRCVELFLKLAAEWLPASPSQIPPANLPFSESSAKIIATWQEYF